MKENTRKNLIETIQLLLFWIMILLIGNAYLMLVGAAYAGETYSHDFGYDILNCSIEGNSSNLEGLNLTWTGTIATINTLINYKPDNFTLSCWINQPYEVEEFHHHYNSRVSNNINLPNQSQQENISINDTRGIETNTDFSYPADNSNLPPIINMTSEELNKETIDFFESVGNFFEGIWNWFRGLFQ
jgi:hypothetical protein